jgi:DNA-binding PadR family transcriptional regulator
MKEEVRLEGPLADLDVLLLSAVKAQPAHGYAIAEALRSSGNTRSDVPEGAVYPALHRLERATFLSSRWSNVDGRRRRIYQLTEKGHGALAMYHGVAISPSDRLFRSLLNCLANHLRKGPSMRIRTALVSLSLVFAVAVFAQSVPNFSGRWVMNPEKGKNLGMMATLKDTVTISQTPKELVTRDVTSFQGRDNTREVHYDLTGQAVSNDSFMGDHNETVAKWVAGKIVTTWTREGAVAGTKSVMTETRSLSADGKTMTLETVRGQSPAVVMVFDKQ